jgi:hypothetical protein
MRMVDCKKHSEMCLGIFTLMYDDVHCIARGGTRGGDNRICLVVAYTDFHDT